MKVNCCTKVILNLEELSTVQRHVINFGDSSLAQLVIRLQLGFPVNPRENVGKKRSGYMCDQH